MLATQLGSMILQSSTSAKIQHQENMLLQKDVALRERRRMDLVIIRLIFCTSWEGKFSITSGKITSKQPRDPTLGC
jgi:hypothetical protein